MAKFRQQDVRNPHFSLPFSFNGRNGGAFVNEQDSFEDIRDCAKAIIAYPVGSRQELPDFGRVDLVFQELNASLSPDQLWDAISRWEPRAALDLDTDQITAAITGDFLEQLTLLLGVANG